MAGNEKRKLDVERKWRYMIPVAHQFYIYSRKAAEELMGPEGADKFIERFWRTSGNDTARMYLELGKLDPNDLFGLVKAVARSSEIMGEDAEAKQEGNRAYVIHHDCPWPKSYKTNGLPESCQCGCDIWFQTVASTVSSRLRVRTTRSIPAGEGICVREFWQEG